MIHASRRTNSPCAFLPLFIKFRSFFNQLLGNIELMHRNSAVIYLVYAPPLVNH